MARSREWPTNAGHARDDAAAKCSDAAGRLDALVRTGKVPVDELRLAALSLADLKDALRILESVGAKTRVVI